MEYQQHQPPEGINTSTEHPLKEFVVLLTGVLGFMVAVVAMFSLIAHLLAPLIPFSVEQGIANTFIAEQKETVTGHNNTELMQYLQSLADRVAAAQGVPDDMPITVHYLESDAVNAFATLGGHVFFFRGLLEKIPDENTLMMVMSHEISHIQHRHPIKSLGRGVVIGATIALVSVSVGSDVVGNIMGDAGLVTALKFSRDHEEQADVEALESMAKIYGHLGGATTLFELLQEAYKGSGTEIEFFSTHPLTDNRIAHIADVAKANGWAMSGALTPLPHSYRQWLEGEPAESDKLEN